MLISKVKATPDIAQLVEHLTVDIRSDQMVPGSIPGVRICLFSSFSSDEICDDCLALPLLLVFHSEVCCLVK